MSGNVIQLQLKSPHTTDDQRGLIACGNCRNKAYTLIDDRPGDFPLLQCCACGAHIGRMGWSHDDDPMPQGTPS